MFPSLARAAILATLLFSFLSPIAAQDALPLSRPNPAPLLPRDSNPSTLPTRSLAYAPAVPLSNAQRLARGLPPNRPRMRTRTRRAPQAQPSSAVAAVAAVAGAGGGAACPLTRGYVAVAYDGNQGFLARTGNAYGEYQYTSDRGQALLVLVPVCPAGAPSSPFDMLTLNGFADYPYVGGVTGYQNRASSLLAGSSDYVYLVGTLQQPRGPATPAPNSFARATNAGTAPTESTIWQLSPGSGGALLPAWVNADGTPAPAPPAQIVYVPGSGAFALVGDLQAFEGVYGPAEPATFTFQAA